MKWRAFVRSPLDNATKDLTARHRFALKISFRFIISLNFSIATELPLFLWLNEENLHSRTACQGLPHVLKCSFMRLLYTLLL
jgi:hypothetical protein